MDNTKMKMRAFHLPDKGSALSNPNGNANYVGLLAEGVSCVGEVANARDSNFNTKAQDIHCRHIAKCWNMYHEMLEFIKSLENDDGNIPKFMWKERNRIIKHSKE